MEEDTAPKRSRSPQHEDLHPGFGQRLLKCESWIQKMDGLCDHEGIRAVKELQNVVQQLVGDYQQTQHKLGILEANINKGGNDLNKHLELYVKNDQYLDKKDLRS